MVHINFEIYTAKYKNNATSMFSKRQGKALIFDNQIKDFLPNFQNGFHTREDNSFWQTVINDFSSNFPLKQIIHKSNKKNILHKLNTVTNFHPLLIISTFFIN